jgi:hypothetical protein
MASNEKQQKPIFNPSNQPPAGRDTEVRPRDDDPKCARERMLDKTLADSYPASDPPSSIPDPSCEDEDEAA